MAERTVELKFKVDDAGSLKLEQIKGNIGKVSQEVSNMDKSLRLIKWDSIINLGERAYQATKQFYDFGKSIVSSLNDIERQAKVLNMSTTELQKWQYAAKMSDVSNEELATGFKFLSRNMNDSTVVFTQIGVEVKNLSGGLKPLSTIMKEIMDKFASWEDGPRKIAIALDIFGRSGESLIPLLNQGSAGFDQFAAAAEKMGIIIDEKLIKKGSEFEATFKNWEERWKSFKLNILGAIDALTKYYQISETMEFSFISGLKKISAEKATIVTPWIIKKGEAPGPILPPEKDWIKEWTEEWNRGITGMEKLGIKAHSVSQAEITDAIETTKIIKQEWLEKKKTGLDYYNSMKAASELMKKVMGDEGKQTEQMLEILDDLDEKIKSISPEDPERTKKIAKFTDDWIAARGKILETYKTPMQIMADIAPAEREFEKLNKEYNKRKAEIEGNSIKIKIENYYSGEGGGISPGGPAGIGFPSDIEVNTNFTATGLSPKTSLGDAFKKIMGNFSTMGEKASGMEVTISFAELSGNLKTLQKSYDRYQTIIDDWINLSKRFSPLADISQNPIIKSAKAFQSEITDQVNLVKLKQYGELYKMGYPGAEEKYYDFFKRYYGGASYQFGTSYVPRTGMALVHQGEKIISANDNRVSVNGVQIYVNGAGDPKEVAREIAKILKYERDGELRKEIQRIR